MADNTPNFDSMTPEEIMAWMESLAKRQGANEGFTTSADLDIPEIDPDSVVIDEPGYVPSEGKDKGKRIEPVVTRRPAAAAPPPPPAPPVQQPVQPQPVASAPPPAADATPDFATMSPDDMMRWMESLAQRQGVDQATLITGGGMSIPEVDPNTKVDWNYTPPEGSKAAKEEAARKAQAPVAASPIPEPRIEPVVQMPPPVTPEPAAASGLSWLESLAADQGAEFPNLDLSSLGADLAAASPAPAQSAPAADPLNWLESLAMSEGAVEAAPAIPSTPAPAASPVNPMDWLSGLADSEGASEPAAVSEPQPESLDWLGDLSPAQISPEPQATGSSDDPIAWLESLARRQNVREEELTTPAAEPPPIPPNPVVDGPGYTPYSFDEPAVLTPPPQETFPEPAASASGMDFSAQDPSAWLDALASAASGRGPAPAEAPRMPEPPAEVPVSAVPAAPAIPEPPAVPVFEAESAPADDDIGSALARGEVVSPEAMERWMNNQLAIGAQREEPEELHGEYDPDAEPVKAELPDWLLEQVGPPIPVEEPPKAPEAPAFPPALIDAIVEPPAVMDMPDWLRDDAPASSDLDDIFTPVAEPSAPAPATPMPAGMESLFTEEPEVPAASIFSAPAPAAAVSGLVDPQIDTGDPWVVAFEQEYQQKMGGIEEMPIPAAAQQAAALAEAALPPETQLPVGEAEAVPDWMSGDFEEEVLVEEEAEAVPGDMPDWLMDAQPAAAPAPVAAPPAAPAPVLSHMPAPHDTDAWLQDLNPDTEVPAWLTEVITSTSENTAVVMQPPPAAAITPTPPPVAPIARPVPVRGASPAPITPQAAAVDAHAALQTARTQVEAGQLDDALAHYEQVIRANSDLDAVVTDLTRVVEKVKNNPAVFRVLGDGLMRQGKLQAALDTYRKALNQL